MSASIATLVAGLPNHQMSPRDYTATDYSDHMDLDNQEDSTHNNHNHQHDYASRADAEDSPSAVERDGNQDRAVSNLLAALSSHSNNGNTATMNQDIAQATSPQLQDAQTENADIEADLQAIMANMPMPTLDAPAANGLSDINTEFPFPDHGQTLHLADGQDTIHHYQSINQPMQSTAPIMDQPEPVIPAPTRREYEAFARLVFPDGNFYLNTYSCELGRDVLAYRAALERQEEDVKLREATRNGDPRPRSAGARSRNPSERLRIQAGSQVQGSIVSEAGGFAGIDENAADKQDPNAQLANGEPLLSSQASNSSGLVKPHELLLDPKLFPYDYKRSTETQAQFNALLNGGVPQDDEQPAPLTADHLPNPNFCPLIPIHATMQTDKSELEGHKGISRRHVKIYWNFDRDTWEMKTLGRNGAFVNDEFVIPGTSARLDDGAVIQISNVQLTFRLPIQKQEEEDQIDVDSIPEAEVDEVVPSIERRVSDATTGGSRRGSTADTQTATKISLKINTKPSQTPLLPTIGTDGQPSQKKRGPGRPPKDGIMSTRERKELEKAKKYAEAKAANGGKTPPPSIVRGKIVGKPTPTLVEEAEQGDMKPEKRKYKKRKRDANGELLPAEEGEDSGIDSEEERKLKKARTQREKSESPAYPSKETFTAEELQRPTDSYAVLLYKLLMEVHPEALPLKQIYRKMKQKWPYFVYEVGTDGWQSSVRHNLNSEVDKLFTKGDKEGKGFAWRAIPNQTPSQQDKKKSVSQQAPPKAKTTPPKHFPQNSQIQWQQPAGPYPQGAWPQAPPNGTWPQGVPPPGLPQPGMSTNMSATLSHPRNEQGLLVPQNSAQDMSAQQQSDVNNLLAHPSSASSQLDTMPCQLPALEAIRRFKVEMFKMLADDEEVVATWEQIFGSAKRRILYGFPESSNTLHGDSEEEHTIMTHLTKFIRRWRNPNFKMSTYEKQCAANGIKPLPSNFRPPPEDEMIPQTNGGNIESDRKVPMNEPQELQSISRINQAKSSSLTTEA